MTIDAQEADKYAEELVRLSIDAQQTKQRIKSIKDALMEYAEVENLTEKIWSCDNGHVELKIQSRTKVSSSIPATVEMDERVMEKEKADEAFKARFSLTKKGKEMLADGDISIASVMETKEKLNLKVII